MEHNIKYWHALYVSSRQEKKVSSQLSERGIENYLPLVKTVRQWSDRKKKVEFPLINGYVFVKTLPQEQDRIYSISGVVNFVRADGKIAVIREAEIDRMKQLIDLGYSIEASQLSRDYQKGDKIKIIAGPLNGIEGYIMEKNGSKNVEVLLESIGQCIKVTLPKDILCITESITA